MDASIKRYAIRRYLYLNGTGGRCELTQQSADLGKSNVPKTVKPVSGYCEILPLNPFLK